MEDVKYVCLSSAGTRGIVFLGFLEGIEDHLQQNGIALETWHEQLKGVAGTSAGAIAGLVLLLGLSREKRNRIFSNLSDARKHIHPDFALLLRNYGWEDGCGLRASIQNILMEGGLAPESTLGDLKRLMRKEFVCMSTDLHTSQSVKLSSTTTPDMKVVDAVFASCCVPFVFTPVKWKDYMLTDGCLTQDLPNPFPETETLFLKMAAIHSDHLVADWATFLQSIVRCSSTVQEHRWDRIQAEHSNRAIAVKMVGDAMQIPSLDMQQDTNAAVLLFRTGYATALNYFGCGQPFSVVGNLVKATMVHGFMKETVERPPDDASLAEETQYSLFDKASTFQIPV